jgi:hypothetical protein
MDVAAHDSDASPSSGRWPTTRADSTGIPFAPEMSVTEPLAPSRTGTSMATVAPHLGKVANQALARRYHRRTGIVTAATFCGPVLLDVPPMVSTLSGLP